MHRCRTMLDKDLINTGIYESAGKQSLPLVQLVQQLLRYLLLSDHFIVHTNCENFSEMLFVSLFYGFVFFFFTFLKPQHMLKDLPRWINFCRNIASQTIARLKDVARRISNYIEAENVNKERSASLDLLLRFQRLLVSKLYMRTNGTDTVNGYSKSCIWSSRFPGV